MDSASEIEVAEAGLDLWDAVWTLTVCKLSEKAYTGNLAGVSVEDRAQLETAVGSSNQSGTYRENYTFVNPIDRYWD